MELQIQPTPDSCMSTCIAMLLGLSAEQVIDEFHDDYKNNNKRASSYIQEKGFFCKCLNTEERNLWPDRLYLLVVPSLNIQGGTHSVVADTRNDMFRILDPNNGKEGRKYYREDYHSSDTLEENEVQIKGYIIELEVLC